MLKRKNPRDNRAWRELDNDYQRVKDLEMKTLFDQDPDRSEKFSCEFDQLFLDFSKNRLDDAAFTSLINLANEMELEKGIEAMFSGEPINETENRAVLHTALRDQSEESVWVNGKDVKPEIREIYSRIKHLCDQISNGDWLGYTGKPIRQIVNIGIGGSHLGPEMVTSALKPYWQHNMEVHYIANVDGTDAHETLKKVDPERALFIVASKSFTTQETLTNAHIAREWFLAQANAEEEIQHHFIAVSANEEKAKQFGMAEHNVFPLWDWVGGRFSLWSAIGLPIAATLGYHHFESLLKGAYAMDKHFREADFANNLPVILALLSIWYNNFFGARAEAVLPYDEYLANFPKHLQQLTMESNGKSVDREGQRVNYPTQPIIFGEPGTNGQHSFFQLLHQGTPLIPCDFLAPINHQNPYAENHEILLANCLAQSEALMTGKSRKAVQEELREKGFEWENIRQLVPYKAFEGNRPSNTLLYQRLTPYTLGQLIALYEHKTFVQGYIWNIFSFDQWGVELGKALAKTLLDDIRNPEQFAHHDQSTRKLLQRIRSEKG